VFRSIRVGSPRTPFVVVAVPADATDLPRGLDVPAATRKTLREALDTPGFKGKPGQRALAGTTGMLVGLGELEKLKTKTLRTLGARLVRELDRLEIQAVRLLVTRAIPKRTVAPDVVGTCLAEGMGLANWRVDFFDGTATKTPDAHGALTVAVDDDARAGFRRGLTLAECANEARRVAATPPNVCNPPWFASETRRLARKAGLSCRVITMTEAEKLGMGGIVNVGKGSDKKPCMVILEHKPARPRKGVRLALVGKTMTYDTGGYSLKISNSMKGMEYDGSARSATATRSRARRSSATSWTRTSRGRTWTSRA